MTMQITSYTATLSPPAPAFCVRPRNPANTVKHIIDAACQFYGVTKSDLIGYDRSPYLIRARFVAIAAARKATKISSPALGKMFGGRDHTTILHATKEANKCPVMAEQKKAVIRLAQGFQSMGQVVAWNPHAV